VTHHLGGLTVQGKPASGDLLELVTIRPAGMALSGRQVQIATEGPHPCGFLVRLVQAPPQGRAQRGKLIDVDRFHHESLPSVYHQTGAHGSLLWSGNKTETPLRGGAPPGPICHRWDALIPISLSGRESPRPYKIPIMGLMK